MYAIKFLKMNKLNYLLIFFISTLFLQAQTKSPWKGYYSYNEIKDITSSDNFFYAASENSIFSKNLQSHSLTTTNTLDGLSGQNITTIYHSNTYKKTIVGYENGLIILINETDGTMKNVVDIVNSAVDEKLKKINHISEKDGILYLAAGFGIIQYNLNKLGFGDTYRIGSNGAEINVNQTTISGTTIYAATANGIKKASLQNPNLIDYNQWETIENGSWKKITTFNNQVLAINSNGQVLLNNGTSFQLLNNYFENAIDIRTSATKCVITSQNSVSVFNTSFFNELKINSTQISKLTSSFVCATEIQGTLYIGTAEDGVFTTTLTNPTLFEMMTPSGPMKNNIFSITTTNDTLWAVYGAYSSDYNPYPLQNYGISQFTNGLWNNVIYKDLKGNASDFSDLVRVTINPKNENQLFVSSYHSGLLQLNNTTLEKLHDYTNSGLESLLDSSSPSYKSVRIEQSAFDSAGNLWMTNGLVQSGLKVFKKDGQWQSYKLLNISNYFDNRFGKMVIDKNGTKWICTSSEGVVAFNEKTNTVKKIKSGSEGNLPIEDARALAIDHNNQLWIGTKKGLRVLSNVDRFNNSAQLNTNAIIILEDNLAQELLYEQFITDIVVDGANNKWIGTADAGVFKVSSDGQVTQLRFSTSNSPLPSNTINDIEINNKTGEVFIATDKGMVSYKGSATSSSEDLGNVVVYPNPVRPEYQGTVKISGLLDKCNVKIADIEGNLVFESIAEGGTVEWDTTAFGKYKVSSGVYMIFVASTEGEETTVKKVMIIR